MANPGLHSHAHRAARRRHPVVRFLVLVLTCLALLAVAGVTAFNLGSDDSGATTGAACRQDTVRLVVDPRLAEVVQQATRDLSPWLEPGDCLTVDVSSRDSFLTADEISRPPGQGLSAPLPDLWIPDSTLWLGLARSTQVGTERLTGADVSVATTPVVIAMTRSRAEAFGWPEHQPTWQRLLAAPEGSTDLALTDVDVDAPGLLTLATLASPGRSGALADLSSRLAVPPVTDRSPARLVMEGETDAISTTEQDVAVTNHDAPVQDQVVAAYDPDLAADALDFPLTVVRPGESEGTGDTDRAKLVDHAADVVSSALRDPATQELFSAAGLRTSTGRLSGLYSERQGVLATARETTQAPSVGDLVRVMHAWESVGRRSRLLILVDRSGSMTQTLPGSRRTRAELAQKSLRQVVEASAPDSDLGLWSFTTGLPTGDSQVLVPTGPLDSSVRGGVTRRDELLDAIDGLDPKPDGGTPLYDAVLAAFRSAQRSYSYGRLNAVIVVTDGRNEDAASIDLPRLLDALRLEFDGVRPVRVIAIAYGAKADTATLRRITDVTGGRTYRALTAGDVSRVFGHVLADL